MPRSKVFVVDLDVRGLSGLIPSLADEGFEVAGSHSDADLLGKIESGAYDLVIDVLRPAGGAAEPVALLVFQPPSPSTPIGVICSALPSVVSVERPIELLSKWPSHALGKAETARLRDISLLVQAARAWSQPAPGETPGTGLELLARAIGADSIQLVPTGDGGKTGAKGYWSGAEGVLPQSLMDLSLKDGTPVLALSTDSAPPQVRGELNARNVGSAFVLPLRCGDRVCGALGAAVLGTKRSFTDYHVQVATLFTSAAARFLESTALVGQHRESERRLAESTATLENRQREVKALNALLQAQYGKARATEEQGHLDQERYLATLRLLTALVEAGDPARAGYAESIAKWALILSRTMNLSVEGLAEASYLHDLGATPAVKEVVRRWKKEAAAGAPTGEEAGAPEGGPGEHVALGEELARLLRLPAPVGQAIRHHHERYDGTGYPEGLAGDKIPIASRLIAVVDSYVAMAGPDPGVPAGQRKAREHLRNERGKGFDPVLVDVFLKVVNTKGLPSEAELISTVSHELRSPLTYLVGYSELLATAQDLPPSAQEAAKEIYSEAHHMARLVEDMLDISRLEMGKAEMRFNQVELGPLIERSVAGARLKSSVHQVEAEVQPALPGVQGDPDRLMQVMDNLLDNAIKYSPGGGRVLAKAELHGEDVRVSVTDHGIGMPGDKLEAIFQKFTRLDSPLKHQVAGTGIGLNLCRLIVEAHGGRIWAESKEGSGSTLVFTLPVKRRP